MSRNAGGFTATGAGFSSCGFLPRKKNQAPPPPPPSTSNAAAAMMMSFFERNLFRKLFFGAASPSPSAPSVSGASFSSSVFFAFAIRSCPGARRCVRARDRPRREARSRMVNDCFRTGKKLPGDKDLAEVSAGPSAPPEQVKYLINHNFPKWHGGCNARRRDRPALGEVSGTARRERRLGGRTRVERGELDRWRTHLSSDCRARSRFSANS